MKKKKKKKDPWFIDSACSSHMTGKAENFTSLQQFNGGRITFGDKRKAEISGMGKVKLTDQVDIDNVSFVEGLGFNLLSVKQLCDQGRNSVTFTLNEVKVTRISTGQVLLKGIDHNDVYRVDTSYLSPEKLCRSTIEENTKLWHRRLGHASQRQINKLYSKDLVVGLPKVGKQDGLVCEDYIKGKQVRSSFPSKRVVSTTKPLELIHIDLRGPMRVASFNGSKYVFVIVDDFSRYTWTIFLMSKDETYEEFEVWVKAIERQLNTKLVGIRFDHGTEFENIDFTTFCQANGVSHNFSAPMTPQQNGVVKRKNRTLEDITRTMLIPSCLPQRF